MTNKLILKLNDRVIERYFNFNETKGHLFKIANYSNFLDL